MRKQVISWILLVILGVSIGWGAARWTSWPNCPPNCPGMWPWCCQFPGEGVPVREIPTPTPGLI